MALNESGFGITPEDEGEVIDPAEPTALDAMNSPSTATTRAGVSTKMDEAELEKIKEDPSVQQRLVETGKDLETYLGDVEKQLPTTEGLGYYTDELSVAQIERDIPRVVAAAEGTVDDIEPSLFKKALKYTGVITDIAKVPGVNLKTNFQLTDGTSLEDLTTEGGLAVALTEEALSLTTKSSVWKYFSGTSAEGQLQELFVKQGIDVASKQGSYDAVSELLRNHPGVIDEDRRYKAVINILKNFRLNDEDLSRGWFDVAEHVVDKLHAISPGWHLTLRDGQTVQDLEPFIKANEGALSLLRYDDRTMASALIQYDMKLKVASINETASRYFPKYPIA